MMDPNDYQNDYQDIAPFSDEEADAALNRLSNHPNVKWISRLIFPDQGPTFLRDIMRNIHTVDEFQQIIMHKAIVWVMDTSTKGFTYSGIDEIRNWQGRYLSMSNHRDIILDPAFFQILLQWNGLPETQICVGDNLLKQKPVELLIRSNRMIKVIRGISARELYLSSRMLSSYIRETITTNKGSVWIAQRQGRTKDGMDTTEQGLLKMLDMSGGKDFVRNFMDLHIIPMSISYEYESCDVMKARELLISRTQKYVKHNLEDLESILEGIKQQKGRVHMHIGKALTEEEIMEAAACDKNDRYQQLRHVIDKRVAEGYVLWPTNYMAWDMLNQSNRFAANYSAQDKEHFQKYLAKRMNLVEPELNQADLKDILLHIYANPITLKENFGLSTDPFMPAIDGGNIQHRG